MHQVRQHELLDVDSHRVQLALHLLLVQVYLLLEGLGVAGDEELRVGSVLLVHLNRGKGRRCPVLGVQSRMEVLVVDERRRWPHRRSFRLVDGHQALRVELIIDPNECILLALHGL